MRIAVEGAAALSYGAVEQAFRQRSREQVADSPGAAGLAENRHVAGIAAKGLDVPAHPFERGDLVEDAVITGDMMLRFGGELREREKTEGAEAILDRHQHDTLPREGCAVVSGAGARAGLESPAVNPGHHGALFGSGMSGGPYVEVK